MRGKKNHKKCKMEVESTPETIVTSVVEDSAAACLHHLLFSGTYFILCGAQLGLKANKLTP